MKKYNWKKLNKKKKGTDERFLFSFKGFEERISLLEKLYQRRVRLPSWYSYIIIQKFFISISFL